MVVLTSFLQPTEGIRLEQRNTTAYVNNTNLGKGTLYIAESRLSWIDSSGNGFSVQYPNISLHAISRDLNAFSEECLFLMLNIALQDDQENVDPDDSDLEITTELRFVPEDRGLLDAMFHAMSACQALHPDPEDSISDEDFYEDADENILEETNSHMANLSIERNTVFSADREGDMAEDRVADKVSDRADRSSDTAAYMEEGTADHRAMDMEEGAAVEHREPYQPSCGYRSSWSSHKDHISSESRWFGDAEN